MSTLRHTAVATVLAAAVAGLTSAPAVAQTPAANIQSGGPLKNIWVGNELGCQVAHASDAAYKRARAAYMQRDDALEARRQRVTDTHEQTVAALDRARRVSAVLRDSDQLRNFTLQQWQQLGRRSLFDVMSAEAEHYNLRVQYVNALHDGQQLNVVLQSLGRGVVEWLR